MSKEFKIGVLWQVAFLCALLVPLQMTVNIWFDVDVRLARMFRDIVEPNDRLAHSSCKGHSSGSGGGGDSPASSRQGAASSATSSVFEARMVAKLEEIKLVEAQVSVLSARSRKQQRLWEENDLYAVRRVDSRLRDVLRNEGIDTTGLDEHSRHTRDNLFYEYDEFFSEQMADPNWRPIGNDWYHPVRLPTVTRLGAPIADCMNMGVIVTEDASNKCCVLISSEMVNSSTHNLLFWRDSNRQPFITKLFMSIRPYHSQMRLPLTNTISKRAEMVGPLLGAQLDDRHWSRLLDRTSSLSIDVSAALKQKEVRAAGLRFKEFLAKRVRVARNGERQVLIMTLNRGHLDQFLNWACSVPSALGSAVVITGDRDASVALTALGVEHYFDATLFGELPSAAAGSYGDSVFGKMMWLKTAPVYLALQFGYSVLFQDLDLVWLRDPWQWFEDERYNLFCMSEMATSHRFEPFFCNSGFYYLRQSKGVVAMYETMVMSFEQVVMSRSQQEAFNYWIGEFEAIGAVQHRLLQTQLFMSGWWFHRQAEMVKGGHANMTTLPVVFHMNWTASRKQKVEHWQEASLYFLFENKTECMDKNIETRSDTSFDAFAAQCCDAALRKGIEDAVQLTHSLD